MLLEVQKLEAGYGATQVLFGIDLSVDEGEVVALMGRNGMGKSTTIRAVLGLNRPTAGSVTFAGRPIHQNSVHANARLGLGLVPEGRRCFANLSVEENLIATARPGMWTKDSVESLFPILGERRHQMANTLSGGEQQMLAIGRALMTNPKLLILDEATEGLAPVIREQIWIAVGNLKAVGQAILVIDKSFEELESVSHRAVILEKGQSVWTGVLGELGVDLKQRYLGI